MIRRSSTSIRLAIIVLAAAALAGCGRKGPLELPPGAREALAAERAEAAAPPSSSVSQQAGALFTPGNADETAPVAPRGRKKAFILDPLLD